MYLNHFCFVLVLVSVSASYFDEELPLYLSDDILISKLPTLSKRSVHYDKGSDDGSTLSKRDVASVDKPKFNNEKEDENKHDELEDAEESGLVFIPSFGRRSRRATPEHLQNKENIPKRASPEQDKVISSHGNNGVKNTDEETEKAAESGLVFLPSFGRRTRRTIAENLQSEGSTSKPVTTTVTAQLTKKDEGNKENNKVGESEKEAESGLVFLPSFGRKTKRSVSENDDSRQKRQSLKGKNAPPETKHNNFEENKKSEIEKEEESGLVFLPSFGRRTRRSATKTKNDQSRHRRDTLRQNYTPSQTKHDNIEINKNGEIEDEEESGLVFLPSFGRRTRRSVTKNDQSRQTRKTLKETNSPPQSERNEHGTNKKSEIEDEEESGLVFIPSFSRRTRRSADKKFDEDLYNSESNIVFLPSFRRNGIRRFRREIGNEYRHYTKRSVQSSTVNKEKATASLTTEKNEELSDSDTVNGEESGLVFLPSFGRRSRRNVAESSAPLLNQPRVNQDSSTNPNKNEKNDQALTPVPKTKRDVSTEIPEKKEHRDKLDGNNDPESKEESGLVFLPSFNRRTRRETVDGSTQNHDDRKQG